MSQTFLTNCKKEEEDVRGKDWKIPKVLIVTHQIKKISKSDFHQNFFGEICMKSIREGYRKSLSFHNFVINCGCVGENSPKFINETLLQ